MLSSNDRTDKASLSSRAESPVAVAPRAAQALGQIVFVGLLVLIAFTTIPYGTVDAWFEAVFESAVFVLTAIWICEGFLSGSWHLNKVLILLPLLILTAYAFFQTVQLPRGFPGAANGSPIPQTSLTIDQYQTHLTAVKMLALTLFTALLLLHVSSRKRLRWLVYVVIALGLGSALFAIARQLLQSAGSMGFGLPFLDYGVGYGQFLSQNVFAFLAEMTLAIVIGVVAGGGIRRQHILIYLSIGLVIWTALVLSNSRGGILGFLCQAVLLGFVALSWFRSKRTAQPQNRGEKVFAPLQSSLPVRILVIVAMVAILVAGAFWMGGDELVAKIEDRNLSDALIIDGSTRKEVWQSTWKLIKHNPWTGVGFGAYYLGISQYHAGSGRIKVEQAHNDYLDLAASGGLVAIVLAALFLGVLIWRGRSSIRSADAFRRAAALGSVAGLLSVGMHSFVDFGLQITGIAVVALALVVILIAEVPAASKLVRVQ